MGALAFTFAPPASNVFADGSDPDYKVLYEWVTGAVAEDPKCIEPASDL